MAKEIKCVNCGGTAFVPSEEYEGFYECADEECRFLIDLRTRDEKIAAGVGGLSEDPMDDLACESCQ